MKTKAQLLDIREVFDVDPTKKFLIADILTDGALLPHSVTLPELMVMDLEPAEEKSETCTCYEFICDNPNCPDHKHLYQVGEFNDSDIQDHLGIYSLGMGV